jgi:hypothetical protein
MQNLLRAAANALAHLAEKAHQLADRADNGVEREFAGVDFVGIDFSTSICRVSRHVIHGWDRYRHQVEVLRPDHGVWAFGVNAAPFPLTRGPVAPRRLPSFRNEHFRRRGHGEGLVEYGSAFYDFFFVALRSAGELAQAESGGPVVPITIALLCDGLPNGGSYRAEDIRPLLEEARSRGIHFKVAGFVLRKYQPYMSYFAESLGLSGEELEVAWYDTEEPDQLSIHSGFASLSHF